MLCRLFVLQGLLNLLAVFEGFLDIMEIWKTKRKFKYSSNPLFGIILPLPTIKVLISFYLVLHSLRCVEKIFVIFFMFFVLYTSRKK